MSSPEHRYRQIRELASLRERDVRAKGIALQRAVAQGQRELALIRRELKRRNGERHRRLMGDPV